MSLAPLIPWVDMYSLLPDPRGRELRRQNKARLAELEAQTPERHERFKVAARAWHAEREAAHAVAQGGEDG